MVKEPKRKTPKSKGEKAVMIYTVVASGGNQTIMLIA